MNQFRLILKGVGSLWFAAVLMVLLMVAMGSATIFETRHTSEKALEVFYHSAWFRGLLYLIALNILAAVALRYPFSRRHFGFLLTHAGLLIILAGALLTQTIAGSSRVSITEGESVRSLSLPQDVLAVVDWSNHRHATLDLAGLDFRGTGPVERPDTGVLSLGVLDRVEVLRYLPDTVWKKQVTDDNPDPAPAVEVSLSPTGRESPDWIFQGQTGRAGEVRGTFRVVPDAAELNRLLTEDVSAGTIKSTVGGETFAFPLETCLKKAVPLGKSGYTMEVLRYLPSAVVEESGNVSDSNPHPNPAVEVEFKGPGGAFKKLAFSRFPDFKSMHGGRNEDEINLVFQSASGHTARTPVVVLAGPDGSLHVRFARGGTSPVGRKVEVGVPVDTPWPGMKFTVLQRIERGRIRWFAEFPEEPRMTRRPAVLVKLTTASETREVWLPMYVREPVEMEGADLELAFGINIVPLGFEVKLNRFREGYYPGTGRPRSFESHITITDPGLGLVQDRVISMNNPATHRGYTFYQSDRELRRQGNVSILSVSWGADRPVVYVGYFATLLGMVWILATRLRKKKRRAPPAGLLVMAAVWFLAALPASAQPEVPRSLDYSRIRSLVVQDQGRCMPLDTQARDVVTRVTGTAFPGGVDPVGMLLAWTTDPRAWMKAPLIAVENAEVRKELHLPAEKEVFSFEELIGHDRLRDIIRDVEAVMGGRKLNPLETRAGEIRDRLILLGDVFSGRIIRLIPDPEDAFGAWRNTAWLTRTGAEEMKETREAWFSMSRAFSTGDGKAFTQATHRLAAALEGLPAAYRPAPGRIQTELRYNRWRLFRVSWILMAVAFLLSIAAFFVRRKGFDRVVVAGMVAGFGVLSWGLYMRWDIAGRIPAANMFESLVFLSWGMGAFAIVALLFSRNRIVPVSASFMGCLSLCLADNLLDPFIRPIMPVLHDTVWMSIHVPIIMISYSVLAMGVLIAHAQVWIAAIDPRREHLRASIDHLHYMFISIGSILLFVGIFTGSMWGSSSWGRYWGWDPKEVWSLVAFLGYMAILHVRVDLEKVPGWARLAAAFLGLVVFTRVVPHLAPLTVSRLLFLALIAAAMVFFVVAKSRVAVAVKSILAIWLIVMTYVGVNFVLGTGLHSYGFGKGAVVYWLYTIGAADIASTVILYIVYRIRQRPRPMPVTMPG